jgi:hypothetical protein
MPHLFCKLIAPRPTFALDMNEGEKALMTQHAAYWAEMCREGAVLVYGPVMDPNGPFGMGVFEGADEAEVKDRIATDPVMKAGIGFKAEVTPMQAMTRESCA